MRAALFDLDGTLTDPRAGIVRCVRYALEAIGEGECVPREDELVRWIGPPLQRSFLEYLGPERSHLVHAAVAAYRERFRTIGMFENAVHPGVSHALEELRARGWTLFVATSKPAVFAEQILAHFDLSRYFARVYGAELSGERSDKSELIAHVLRVEGLSPQSVTMIGDRSHDMIGARRNAVRAFGVLWGYGSREELADAGAHGIFSTLPELVAGLQPLDGVGPAGP